jgi:hypothetical protein
MNLEKTETRTTFDGRIRVLGIANNEGLYLFAWAIDSTVEGARKKLEELLEDWVRHEASHF